MRLLVLVLFLSSLSLSTSQSTSTTTEEPIWGIQVADDIDEGKKDVEASGPPDPAEDDELVIEGTDAPRTINDSYEVTSNTLVKRIMNGYNPQLLPRDDDKPVEIELMFYISHLRLVEDPVLTMHAQGTLIMKWRDKKTGWNPADYDGLKRVMLHEDDHIWTPRLACLSRGCSQSMIIDREIYRRTYLQVHEDSRYQSPFVQMAIIVDQRMDCEHEAGAFPRDSIKCVLRLVSRDPLMAVQLQRQESTSQMVFMRGQTRPIAELPVSGWEVLSTTQKIRIYDLYRVVDKEPRDLQRIFYKSVFEVEIRMRRFASGKTLLFLMLSWETALFLLCSFFVAIATAPMVVAATIFFHSLVLRHLLNDAPETIDGPIPPLVLQSLLTWLFSVISALFHYSILNFPALSRPVPPSITRWLPFYSRLEEQLNASKSTFTPSPMVLYVRLLFCALFTFLYFLIAFEYLVE